MQHAPSARRPRPDLPGSSPAAARRSAGGRRLRWGAAAAAAAVVVFALGVTLRAALQSSGPSGPPCRVGTGPAAYTLELDQAANATTIAAVGKRLGLPDHAVTIALAAALQESQLHNLNHGDRDSLGLFQQRPSQGWGTPSQILTPRYAATAFYNRLALVAGWQGLSVTDAAQQVQQSGAPNAYSNWQSEARVLAVAFTGERAAGLACRFHVTSGPVLSSSLALAMSQELGQSGPGGAVSTAWGWVIANWLVAHARQYRIPFVTFGGQKWTPASAVWVLDSSASSQVRISLAEPPPAGAQSA